MNMPDGEIITAYKQAKDRKMQIEILADMNCCSRDEMAQHLVKLGCIHSAPPPSFDYIRAAELYAEGKSDLEIAQQLGVAKSKVGDWRRSKNLAPHRVRCATGKEKAVLAPVPAKLPAKRNPHAVVQQVAFAVRSLAEALLRVAERSPDAIILVEGSPVVGITVLSNFGVDGAASMDEVRLVTRGESHEV